MRRICEKWIGGTGSRLEPPELYAQLLIPRDERTSEKSRHANTHARVT